jgi:DNA-binding MarR family transcriptional regulator
LLAQALAARSGHRRDGEVIAVRKAEPTESDLLNGELFRLTRLTERVHARHTARQNDGVERAAYLLLVTLVKHGPRRLSVLAEEVHSDASTVSRQVAQLVQLGLVERRPDPTDGRASTLAATEAGERNVECKRRARNKAYAEMLADWTESDRRRLRELLARFNDDFEGFFLDPAPVGAATRPGPVRDQPLRGGPAF